MKTSPFKAAAVAATLLLGAPSAKAIDASSGVVPTDSLTAAFEQARKNFLQTQMSEAVAELMSRVTAAAARSAECRIAIASGEFDYVMSLGSYRVMRYGAAGEDTGVVLRRLDQARVCGL